MVEKPLAITVEGADRILAAAHRARTPLFVGMTLLSAVSWLFECLAAYVCVRGLELDLSFPDTIVVFTLFSAGCI